MRPFNYTPCLTDPNTNTGFARCVAKLGMLSFTMALPRNTRIALADAQPDTLLTTLTTLLTDPDPSKRAYLVGRYWKVMDTSAEEVTENGDGGAIDVLYDGAYNWTRQQKEGGLCAHDAMRRLSGTQDKFDFLEIFKSNDVSSRYYVVGTLKPDPLTNNVEFAGIRYDMVFSPKFGLSTGTESAKFLLKTSMLDVRQINEDRGLVGINFEVADLPRVMDVNLQLTKVSTGVFDLLGTMACGGENITDLYSTIDDPSAVIVLNELGNVVSITGVTVVGGKLRLALTTADADYTAGTKFRAKLAPLDVITATPLDADYIESKYSNFAAK